MPPPELRSLDRFITVRGAALAGVTNNARQMRVMGFMTSLYGLLGGAELGIGTALALSGKPLPALLVQGGIFLLTGGLMAGVVQGLKRRMQQEPTIPVEIAPEAKALLQTLLSHLYGWPLSRIRRRRRYRRLMRQTGALLPKEARCEEILRPETFALLENAAQEANRVYGLLEQAKSVPSSPLKQMAPSIIAAADEAMTVIFRIAAQMEKFPESGANLQEQAQNQIAELQTLAEQIEPLCAFSEMPSSSRLPAILHALNADLRAREELKASEYSPALSVPPAPHTEEETQILVNRSS